MLLLLTALGISPAPLTAEALPLAPAVAHALAAGRRRALESEDYAEGLAAFAERRAPRFRGV